MSDIDPENNLAMPPVTESISANQLEERLAATLYLAGEALVPAPTPEPANHAVAADDRSAPLLEDFQWLNEIIAQFRQALAADPKRAELLRLLPQGFGDGEILRVLFCGLFPEQRDKRKQLMDRNGKPKLSAIQVEILRHVAVGMQNPEIAAKLNLTDKYVGSALQNINRKLNASSRMAAVAVAISMGYLPLDVLDWVHHAANCPVRDYSPLDCMLSYVPESIASLAPGDWRELAAFGLMLMAITGNVVDPHRCAANPPPADGVIFRLDRQPGGEYRMQRVVGPGLLRNPMGIAIAPPAAQREGFTPGHLFAVHQRATHSGRNNTEVAEFTSGGQFIRAFCGSPSLRTQMYCANALCCARSGALLVATGGALLRFTDGGRMVRALADDFCREVCVDRNGQIYAAFSSRGGSIRVYSAHGNLLREFAQQQPGSYYSSVRLTAGGEIAALAVQGRRVMMQFYDTQGEQLRCWRAPDNSSQSFAIDNRRHCYYLPAGKAGVVHVYTPEGKLHQTIEIDRRFTPHHITLANDRSLWLSGGWAEASA